MLTDFQAEKKVVRDYHSALAAATPETVADILARHVAPDWHWRGMHPFHEQHGAEAVAEVFWAPFLTAMTREGSVTPERAVEIGKLVLRENAVKLYSLK